MSARTQTVPEPAATEAHAAPAPPRGTQPFRWSLRRELWENRAIYLAPLGVGAFAVVALVIHALTMPSHMPGMLANDPLNTGSASVTYRVVALLMLASSFITGAFYSLEALSSERRDRSILFWRSMPVSDLTTVLAKASVPLAVLPLVTFAVTVAAHVVLFLLSLLALALNGHGPGPLWRELQFFRIWPALLYATAAMSLWHAPIHGFLMLASGWARRTAVLWAVLPLLAVGVLEKLIFDTTGVALLAVHRLVGWYHAAFLPPGPEHIPFDVRVSATPGGFLAAPGLWIGLALAVLFLAAAVRMRRLREPV
jgi:ABC-2 type transport system permease protein